MDAIKVFWQVKIYIYLKYPLCCCVYMYILTKKPALIKIDEVQKGLLENKTQPTQNSEATKKKKRKEKKMWLFYG